MVNEQGERRAFWLLTFLLGVGIVSLFAWFVLSAMGSLGYAAVAYCVAIVGLGTGCATGACFVMVVELLSPQAKREE